MLNCQVSVKSELKPEFLQILNVDFLRIPSVQGFDILHFELRLTLSLA